ncbi:MAG: hypothetical protein A2Y40_08745 [Candidatus Margulisbacteria bacterium GWF2_35_9]|nr:MAG: hypothetical protein A2Y40_08745 [Candidatus Margulisbacteria bacterium GWF2_35_9]
MKKLLIVLLLISLLIFTACTMKDELEVANMIGVYVSDKATLKINEFTDTSIGKEVDFQFDYTIPDKKTGTLFGNAEETDENTFEFSYESLGVMYYTKLFYEDDYWIVEYIADDPENKEHFDFSGTYHKRK